MAKYYKVVEVKPKSVDAPGYLTRSHDTVSNYLCGFLSGENDPDYTVYVIEVNVDVKRLKTIEGCAFGYDQDKNILPGYKGTEVSPEDGIKHPLDVIVWNEPTPIKVVGAYVWKYNISISPEHKKYTDRYKPDGNAWRDSDAGVYTFDDLIKLKNERSFNEALDRLR